MSIEVFGEMLQRYARINTMIMETYGQKCVSTDYKAFVKDMQSTSWNSSIAEGGSKYYCFLSKYTGRLPCKFSDIVYYLLWKGRQWTYQTCTEFGFYQSTDSKNQVYGTMFPLKWVRALFSNSNFVWCVRSLMFVVYANTYSIFIYNLKLFLILMIKLLWHFNGCENFLQLLDETMWRNFWRGF